MTPAQIALWVAGTDDHILERTCKRCYSAGITCRKSYARAACYACSSGKGKCSLKEVLTAYWKDEEGVRLVTAKDGVVPTGEL